MTYSSLPPGPPPTYLRPQPQRPQNNWTGAVSVLLAALNLVLMFAAAGFSGRAYRSAVRIAGVDFDVNDPRVDPHMSTAVIWFLVAIGSWLISIVPFVLGILGVRKPPRSMGIAAIILSVITPVLGVIAWAGFVVTAG